ncbi:outer membrane beta-barrel protein [Tamlana sp. 2_MG-2023]|uniref:outer membrane beta-barrel protein n=1 Tax=unclassified Tamlana TaxID=2614803 RepID=UPI0026E150FD|nr:MULTISPECIES: outer membrane beta-barrel protein [unclassified Tamlana]MDO6758602.1 outer membrane beta-barrel protein [Tamlana sp. 2_MG-2023]MDO6789301.1 outer membrane beta-barrel protein [Tamlana sp. 1_MG-2023]
MKKWLLTIFCFGMITLAYAQRKSSFGFRSGVNFSEISRTQLETKTGFYLSFLGHFKFTEFYALQPEIGYSLQGGQSETVSEANVDIHYITVTVANKFFIKDSGFHFIIAPGFDFDADDTLIGLYNNKDGNDVSFIDLTVSLGVGYEFNNGLGIEARYKQGTIDVFSGTFNSFESEQLSEETQLNSTFQLGLFYKFNF